MGVNGNLHMKKNGFKNITVLIWDVDGTLYQPNEHLWREVREAEYRVIMNHLQIDRKTAVKLFNRDYKKVSPSATQTVARLAGITTPQAALEMDNYYDRRNFLKRDQKLVQLFAKLENYTHFILANGTKKRLTETLIHLGLDPQIFEEIVTSELVGENKPSEVGFRYILAQTGLSPEEHLMIGDRQQVDLLPAKKLGMKTCLVFAEKTETKVDFVLKTVYDIEKIL